MHGGFARGDPGALSGVGNPACHLEPKVRDLNRIGPGWIFAFEISQSLRSFEMTRGIKGV
jgi:hypothetical protein